MPRLLALDWTRYEARYVIAGGSGDKLSIESAGAISLADLSDAEFADADKLGGAIRSGLSSAKVGRATPLVAVSRAQVELLDFSVPPVPESELPEIVRNLAIRESPAITDESTVDFVVSPDATGEATKVTAAAITAETLSRIKQACTAAKLSPQRMTLRPYATAALLPPGSAQRSLLVNRVGEDVDLTVVDGGNVVFSRTVRVPPGDADAADAGRLMQEIRRTMMVAPHGSGENSVDAVYLLGRETELAEILEVVRREFSADNHTATVDVSVFDVFASLGVEREMIPDRSGSYAALLGMLRTESQGDAPAFDFLNPRKPPKPPDRKRIAALVGGFALMAAGYFLYPMYEEYQENQDTIAELEQEIKEAKASDKTIKKQAAIAGAISKWEAGGVNWLDELETFSARFPPPRDAMVLRMALSSSRGGTISFNGLARDPAVVTRMELDLRDDTHDIQTPRVQERKQENGYTWQFETKLNITPAKPDVEEDEDAADSKSDKKSKPAAKPDEEKKPAAKDSQTKPKSKAAKSSADKPKPESKSNGRTPAEENK